VGRSGFAMAKKEKENAFLFAKSFKVIKVPVVNRCGCNFVADKCASDLEKCVWECRRVTIEREKSGIKGIKSCLAGRAKLSVENEGIMRTDYRKDFAASALFSEAH
jgi:hypothetical protein